MVDLTSEQVFAARDAILLMESSVEGAASKAFLQILGLESIPELNDERTTFEVEVLGNTRPLAEVGSYVNKSASISGVLLKDSTGNADPSQDLLTAALAEGRSRTIRIFSANEGYMWEFEVKITSSPGVPSIAQNAAHSFTFGFLRVSGIKKGDATRADDGTITFNA